MAYCTIVEFEWNDSLDRDRFASMIDSAGMGQNVPEGRLSQITGFDVLHRVLGPRPVLSKTGRGGGRTRRPPGAGPR
jgi:hypothetical protein